MLSFVRIVDYEMKLLWAIPVWCNCSPTVWLLGSY